MRCGFLRKSSGISALSIIMLSKCESGLRVSSPRMWMAERSRQFFPKHVDFVNRHGFTCTQGSFATSHQPMATASGTPWTQVLHVSHTVTHCNARAVLQCSCGSSGKRSPQRLAIVQVIPIPPNRPSQRADHPLELYTSEQEAEFRIAAIISTVLQSGQPLLIGTDSTADSTAVYELTKKVKIQCADRVEGILRCHGAAALHGHRLPFVDLVTSCMPSLCRGERGQL